MSNAVSFYVYNVLAVYSTCSTEVRTTTIWLFLFITFRRLPYLALQFCQTKGERVFKQVLNSTSNGMWQHSHKNYVYERAHWLFFFIFVGLLDFHWRWNGLHLQGTTMTKQKKTWNEKIFQLTSAKGHRGCRELFFGSYSKKMHCGVTHLNKERKRSFFGNFFEFIGNFFGTFEI